MTETKTCTACGKTNSASATVCAHCSAPLLSLLPSKTTSHVPLPQPDHKAFAPERVVHLTRLYSDIIVFQIANHEQPVLVKVTDNKVTLGRYSPGEKPPSVDFTPFNGSLMGVSRQHAAIIKDDEGYKIRDLSSTNGTWLNETRLAPNQLYPLQSGDIVRFGQINTSIYFRLAEKNDAAETTLLLTSDLEATKPLRLTVEALEAVVLPYIKALVGFQTFCDEFMTQTANPIMVTGISMDSAKPVLTIKLSGLFQAFRLLRNEIFRWRETHVNDIIKLHEAKTPAKDWTTNEDPSAKTASLLESTLSNAGIALGLEILMDLAPQRSLEENKVHLPKLLPHLQILALSPLRPSDEAS